MPARRMLNQLPAITVFALACCFVACKGGASPSADTRVRVKVPEAKCEIALPGNMTIASPKASGFTIVEKGKNPMLDGMLIVVMPVGPIGGFAPGNAKELKVLKDKTNADGSVEREGSYNNGIQTLHVAEYIFPVGKEWLHCKIQAAKPERRDEVAKLCAGLAPTAL